jgi:NADH-quinone oxidoreductase subunit N
VSATVLAAAAASISNQVDSVTGELAMPHVDWAGIAPATILIGAACVLLVVASLARHTTWIQHVYAPFTVVSAFTAGLFTINLWQRLLDGVNATVVANAINIDGFSIFITATVCSVLALAALIAQGFLRREQLDGPEFYVLAMLSASGGVIMGGANDLLVMFLGLEILSIALYVLAGSHLRRTESQESALKYFVLGGFASALFLYGVALTYGATGSTNFDDITRYLNSTVVFKNGLLVAGTILMIVGLGFKIAAVPFHMWTPDVYQGSPSPVTGFMAAGAKAAGFAGLLRILFSGLATRRLDWQPIIWVLAIATMAVGAVLAAVQTDIKRMMAYSSISHAGFILIGVQAASDRGLAAALFYLLTYAFVVLGTFAVISIVGRTGDSAHALSDYKGLARRSPVLAITLTLFLLAQAGIPATSGFIAKFGVIMAAADAHSYAIAIIAMLVSVIGGYFYLRVIVQMYMHEPDESTAGAGIFAIPGTTQLALLITAAFTLYAGMFPGALLHFAERALLR